MKNNRNRFEQNRILRDRSCISLKRQEKLDGLKGLKIYLIHSFTNLIVYEKIKFITCSHITGNKKHDNLDDKFHWFSCQQTMS